ncbi:MAG: YdcF family protein [Nitriliruptoraceae bacterium]
MRRHAWWIVLLASILAVATSLTVFLVPRDDALGAPDLVVVLGGGGPERAALGMELADRLDADLALSSTAALATVETEHRCGVEVHCFEPDPHSTAGEARHVDRLVAGTDQQVLVVTSDFHTSRSRLLFEQCLADQVGVVGATREMPWYRDAYNYAREALATVANLTFQRAC